MTHNEKAKMILEFLDKRISVDWNFEDFYIRSILEALYEIEEIEKEAV